MGLITNVIYEVVFVKKNIQYVYEIMIALSCNIFGRDTGIIQIPLLTI